MVGAGRCDMCAGFRVRGISVETALGAQASRLRRDSCVLSAYGREWRLVQRPGSTMDLDPLLAFFGRRPKAPEGGRDTARVARSFIRSRCQPGLGYRSRLLSCLALHDARSLSVAAVWLRRPFTLLRAMLPLGDCGRWCDSPLQYFDEFVRVAIL